MDDFIYATYVLMFLNENEDYATLWATSNFFDPETIAFYSDMKTADVNNAIVEMENAFDDFSAETSQVSNKFGSALATVFKIKKEKEKSDEKLAKELGLYLPVLQSVRTIIEEDHFL